MAEYRLLTIWRIEAPLEEVYAAIHNSPRWPDWWPGMQKVEPVAAGNAAGINSVLRYSWQGKMPYRVVFEVLTTHIEKLVAIEGTARGDLEGIGRWHFSRQGSLTVVRYEWHVRSTRWWMNLFAPVVRAMFIRNHALIMEQGGEGLARLLKSPLVSQENIDLMAETIPPRAALGPWRERGRIDLDPTMALFAGFVAGVISTVAQLALWWLAEMPLPETLFRDARLAAAMVMGSSVLPPPSTAQWDILALKAARELVPKGAVLDLIQLHGIPVFNQDDEMSLPATVLEFKRRILAADAILFATPEYNYSLPGGLKNAIDWASRPYGESAWLGKPAAVMGASAGSLGSARAQYHLRQVLVTLDMPVVNQPEVMIGNAAQWFDQNGRLTDEPTRQLIQQLLGALLQLAFISPTSNSSNPLHRAIGSPEADRFPA